MSHKALSLVEGCGAEVAVEWLLSCVDANMLYQIAALCEGLATVAAWVTLDAVTENCAVAVLTAMW